MNSFEKFRAIRKAYEKVIPEIMEEYKRNGRMEFDPYFLDWEFSPIEMHLWSDIRSLGVPFLPQFPVLNYFIDFGCPQLKIGIEADGKDWHDPEKDKIRDARLYAEGWMIFRIQGHECHRQVEPWIEDDQEIRDDLIEKYFMTSSEGIVSAIKRQYFDICPNEKYKSWTTSTLSLHRSTPETYPIRKFSIEDVAKWQTDILMKKMERSL